MATALENSIAELDLDDASRHAFGVLAEYWQEIRGEAPCPPKSAFDPIRIVEILPQIALMQILDDGSDVIYRLYAAGLRERSNHDYTGDSIFASLPDEWHQPILDAFMLGRQLVAGCYLEVDVVFPYGDTRRVDALFLPLTDKNGNVNLFINLLFMNEEDYLPVPRGEARISYVPRGMQLVDLGNRQSGIS